MKYFSYILLVASLLLSGCEGTALRHEDQSASSSFPIPVKVSSANTNRKVAVYAFLKNERTSYSVTSAQDLYQCLMDATTDGLSVEFGGRQVWFDSKDYIGRWNGKTVYWPSKSKSKFAYDFFAYSIDGVDDYQVIRTEDAVNLIFDINGTQDLLLSKAVLTKQQISKLNYNDLQLARHLSFSHFTAARNIYPVFSLHSQLVKLEVEVVADAQNAPTRIAVLSPKKAVFTVAHKDEACLGVAFKDNMDLISAEAAPTYALTLDASNTLFVAPCMSYEVFVTQNLGGKQTTSSVRLADFSETGGFRAGQTYKIRLTINAGGNISAAIVK